MTLYLDTSAAAKLFVEEAGSEEVAALLTERGGASSVLINAELPAALGIAQRQGRLSEADASATADAALELLHDFLEVPAARQLCVNAGELALKHGLRGYDSVHLASALFLQFAAGAPVTFATFDRALWRAARDEGLDPWPPGWGN